MTSLNKIVLATVMALSATTAMTAHAAAGESYIGVKAGKANLKDAKDNPTTYGVYGGYQFTDNIGMELEYQNSGKAAYEQGTGYKTDYKLRTFGAYATYKYPFGNFYAKGKLGYAQSKASLSSSVLGYDLGKIKSRVRGVGYGVGVGYNVGSKVALEVDYGRVAKDANNLNLGVAYRF